MTTLCKTLNDVDEQCSEQHLEDVEILRVDLGIWDFAEYTLNHVSFQNTPLIGVNFRKCQASNITFSVNTSDDRGFWMRGINFATSILVDSQFESCGMQEAIFLGSTLQGVRFHSSQLPACNFSGAKIVNSTFQDSTLSSANFERASIIRSSFSGNTADNGAAMERVNFRNAILIDVDFSRANLFAADFSGAVLIRANFKQANLTHCNFDGCIQIDSVFKQAEIEDETLNRLIELSATKTQILREQNQIQDALENHSKEELIELVSHLTKAYVIDSPALSGSMLPDSA
ncbi:MAG TPA: pentapeptide repeat-containing protein, partial [Myxococcales bacterium]|nr:pentapeptide repeat-containing protein [Myxococcales bacterium]